ncbi:uncharacterized protein BDW70DRAFT_139778 [Aspergillus foveolatus]|uniref:uncharacterized protein n=1 Tax=Aspergillus foveolatus TaxID=210207 RepID=UPI003CCD2747
MRPPVPEIIPPRSRKSSLEQQQWIDPRSATPSTFFLARSQRSDEREHSPAESEGLRDSMYGIQSFDGTTSTASSVAVTLPDLDASSISKPVSTTASPAPPPQWNNNLEEADDASSNARQSPTLRDLDSIHIPRLEASFLPSNLTSPRPFTPLNYLNSDDQSSLPSSPKSITNQSTRHLDEISITDDLSSQAVASGDEEEDPRPPLNPNSEPTSQLIMPSITIPSRRPFTEKGKALGRMKLLLAGAAGSGKTSLIKSIVQACDDIVHVDPFDEPSHPLSLSRHGRTSRTSAQLTQPPALVSEIYASSKPYPTWWSDLEDSRVLRRRKSSGEVVLERNICFVDVQGHRLSQAAQIDTVIKYISQQLSRAVSALESSNVDFQNMLAGNGGSQVDAVLYLISHDKLHSDIECISKLSTWTNVIPLIAKSDLLTRHQILNLRNSFNEKAQAAPLKTFQLNASDIDEQPFAVSSAKSNDDSIMDASTLMNPDYMQPLVASDLTALVQSLFDRETMAWIRHSAAKKLAQRQRDILSRRRHPLQDDALSFASSAYGLEPSYAMARVSDHSRHEEKRARIQLAKWASDLQQSLQNERERYAALARSERAVWLTERLGECVVDGSLVPVTQTPGFCGLHMPSDKPSGSLLVQTKSGQRVEYHIANVSSLDPLGVVRWLDDLKQRGWAIVQIVGSFGVVGGLALWLAKTWGLSSRSFSEWRFDWYCTSD